MGQEQEAGTALFEVDLGRNGGKFAPRSVERLEYWIDTEDQFWSWLEEAETKHLIDPFGSGFTQFAYSHGKAVRTLRQHIKELPPDTEDTREAYERKLSEIRDYLIAAFSYRPNTPVMCVHSSTMDAKRIDHIKETLGRVEAVAALNSVCTDGTQNQPNHVDLNRNRQFGGLIALWMMRAGVQPEAPTAVRKALDELHENFRHALAVDEMHYHGLEADLKKVIDDHKAIVEQANRALATAVKQARAKAAQQREEISKALEELESLYNTKLALQEPVEYYDQEAERHAAAARKLAWVFVGLVLSVAGAAAYLALSLTDLGLSDFLEKSPLAAAGLSLTVIGFLVWLPRIVLRSLMSHLHLRNDARHRRTMALTYLALREGGHAAEEQMSLVLSQLFAPTSDGLVKEEIGPLVAAEALKALKFPKATQ